MRGLGSVGVFDKTDANKMVVKLFVKLFVCLFVMMIAERGESPAHWHVHPPSGRGGPRAEASSLADSVRIITRVDENINYF